MWIITVSAADARILTMIKMNIVTNACQNLGVLNHERHLDSMVSM